MFVDRHQLEMGEPHVLDIGNEPVGEFADVRIVDADEHDLYSRRRGVGVRQKSR